MYKRKKQKNKIIIVVVIISLFVLLTVSLLVQGNGNHKNNVFKNIIMMVDKVIMFPFTALNNDKNIDQSKSKIIEENANKELQKEIKELTEVLELNKSLTEFDSINATVLSRNKSYWFNTITIDKGDSSGIKENMAVITKNGLIGKVSKVYRKSSEIKLITSDDVNFKVSVAVNTNGVDNYAIMNGYDNNTKTIQASGIDKTTVINKGDIVLTSGLGEMFPAGIYIGEVENIKSDKYNLSKIIFIKTKQNFNDIHYVTVLKVKS